MGNIIKDFLSSIISQGIGFEVSGEKLLVKGDLSLINDEQKKFLKENKEAIIAILNKAKYEAPVIEKVMGQNNFPLSYSQQSLWLLDKINGGSSHYNLSVVFELEGEIDYVSIEKTFRNIVERHKILRTYFHIGDNGEPFQEIQSADKFVLKHEILNGNLSKTKDELISKIEEEISQPFNLQEDILLRVTLLQIDNSNSIMTVTMHHIASDGWSMGILVKEFNTIYPQLIENREINLPELKIDYYDYASWQKKWLKDEVLENYVQYWTTQLQNAPQVHSLPLDKKRPLIQDFKGKTYKTILSNDDLNVLKAICKEEDATLFMGLHSIFSILISRYSNESDIVIGTPIANREQPEIQDLVGFFMNLLVLRLDMSDNPTFRQLVRKSKKVLLDAYQYQQMPFDKLVEELKIERGLGHSPLFQILLSLDNNQTDSFSLPNLSMKPIQSIAENVSKYDLSLNVKETNEGLLLCWEYSTNLFLDETIERMASNFINLLKNSIKYSDENIYTLDVVSNETISELIIEGNEVNTNELVHVYDVFLAHASKKINDVALIFKGTEYTYGEFVNLIDSIGDLLTSKGLKQGDRAGICLFRNVEMIASIFACFKQGIAYVPLDPSYPSERISQIVEEASPKVVITESSTQKLYSDFLHNDICCFIDEELVVREYDNLVIDNFSGNKEDSAYIIFTSGTTGKPKGIEISHSNLSNLLYSLDTTFGNHDQNQTWLAQTSINFDISVLELIWTLSRGHKVVLQQSNPLSLYSNISQGNDRKMSFSVLFFGADKNEESKGKYDLLLKIAQWIDDKEFEAIWTPERHFAEFGGAFPSPSVLGSAIAMVTKNIGIRAGSVVIPMHDPIRVAEEWSVIDNLSNGRVGISVASGWHPNDFVFADGEYQNRHAQMKSKVEELKKLWRGEVINRMNGVGAEISLQTRPTPLQKELPLWVTSAGNKETFIYAGQIGANVLTHMLGQNLDQLEENIKVYNQTLLENGFSIEERKVTVMLHTYLDETLEEAYAVSEKPFKSYLTSSIKLMEPLAAELGLDIHTQLDEIVDIAYLRFSRNNTLIGTEKSFQEMTAKLNTIGITEIACLVDFGVENEKVFESLKRVNLAKNKYQNEQAKASVVDVKNYKTELQLIQEHNITHVQMTPSQSKLVVKQLEQSNSKNISNLAYWLMGGEPITQDVLRSLKSLTNSRVYNMYGPTETTVWSAWREIYEDDFAISGVIDNTTFILLNSYQKPVPKGVVGELYIGGEGVAKGYYDNQLLTEEKFLNLNINNKIQRFYRTGDLMRLNEERKFEYIGRKDDQVKINGYRIEIEDIESNILNLSGIQDCKVVTRKDEEENYLSAFVVLPSKVHNKYTNLPIEKQAKAYKFPDNSVVYHQSDRQLSMLYKEIFEDEVYFKHGIELSDNPIVMDVGANIGTFSMHVKQKYPEAYVVAFEPIPQIFSGLKKNFEHRNIRGKVLNYGISDKNEQARFHYYPEMAGMSGRFANQETILEAVEKYIDHDKTTLLNNEEIVHSDLQLAKSFYETLDNKTIPADEIRNYLETIYQSEEVECELTTISNTIDELGLPYIDLLKIDVEKSEHLAIRGIQEPHWKIIKQIVIEVDGDNNLEFITSTLNQKGFEIINDELVMSDSNAKNEDNTYLLYAFNRNFVYPNSNNFFEKNPLITVDKIRDYLSEKVPSYMVPREINVIPVMPLLMNGKIDVNKLKSIQINNVEKTPVRLENKTEMEIYNIWCEVLKKDSIPPHISIFEAGGNSLQMIVLHERLQKEFAVEFSVIDLFRNPTIALQAKLVTNSIKKDVSSVKKAQQKGASRRNVIRNKQN